MRKDMHKLLCLRPRLGGSSRSKDKMRAIPRNERKKCKIVSVEDEEGYFIESDADKNISMKGLGSAGGSKYLNEYFSPIKRYLQKQIEH